MLVKPVLSFPVAEFCKYFVPFSEVLVCLPPFVCHLFFSLFLGAATFFVYCSAGGSSAFCSLFQCFLLFRSNLATVATSGPEVFLGVFPLLL